MRTNQAGIDLIKGFEGLELKSYKCPAGVWTIGYGHTGREVKPGQSITEHQAEVILKHDLEKYEEGVEHLTRALDLSPSEFSALVSFSFNVGTTALANSTLLKKLRAGDKHGAADQFLRWTKAGGKVLAGLVRRREAERSLFLEPA